MSALDVRAEMRVRINCPSARKYPRFHEGFHGKTGQVVAVYGFGSVAVVRLDGGDDQINVEPSWLSRSK